MIASAIVSIVDRANGLDDSELAVRVIAILL